MVTSTSTGSTGARATLLVTGAGGAAVPTLIASLRCQGYRVLAADIDPQASGLYLADKGLVVPRGDSADFLPALRRICRREKVAVVIPLVDEELLAAGGLEADAVEVLLPRPEFTRTCLDKYLLMQALDEHKIAVPETRLAQDGGAGLGFPLVVKPRRGRGSRGLFIARDQTSLDEHLAASAVPADQLLLQSHIEGDEFTVSVVVWRDGKVQAVVPKQIVVKRGITRIAVTRRVPAIRELCIQIQAALNADGPFNVQLRIDTRSGQPLPFEINPRLSTTTVLTKKAGVDEIGGLTAQALGRAGSRLSDDWREGVAMVRHYGEFYMDEAEFLNHPIEAA